MAEQEFYRLDLVISATGIDDAEKRLRTMDRFMEQTRKRADMLNRVKMSPVARLEDRVSPSARRIDGTLRSLTSRTWNVIVGIKDMTAGALGGIRSRIGSMMRSTASAAFSLPSVVAGSAAAYGGVVKPIQLTSATEQGKIAFTTMLKDAEKAKKFMAELEAFAERTPFDTAGLRDAAQRMLAFKFKQEEIIPDLTIIGDWAGAMGKGKEGIDRVVLAFGQMKAKGRVQGDEMLQLTEAGINGYDYLSKAIGVSTAQVMKLQEKGLIPANQAIEAIMKGMKQDFGGAMKLQETTLLGLWNKFNETFDNKILRKWGDGIAQGIQPRMIKLSEWMDRNSATIQRWGNQLQKISGQAADWIAAKFEKALRLLDDPAFQKADLLGKAKIVWDDVVTEPFSRWWSGGGRQRVEALASNIGSAIGDGLRGVLTGALGMASPDKLTNESPFMQAGAAAGKAFLDSFVKEFDVGQITKKLAETTWNINKEAVVSPTGGNIAGAAITDALLLGVGAAALNKIFKPFKKMKEIFQPSPKVAAGNAVEVAVEKGASVAKSVTAAREVVAATPKSPYSSGWNPRYLTPPKPEMIPKMFHPGIPGSVPPAVSKFASWGKFLAPEVTIPLTAADMLIHSERQKNIRAENLREALGEMQSGKWKPIENTKLDAVPKSHWYDGIRSSFLDYAYSNYDVKPENMTSFLGKLFPSINDLKENINAARRKPDVSLPTNQNQEVTINPVLNHQTNSPITLTMQQGAVQVIVRQEEIDESVLMNKVGIPIIQQISRIFENRP